MSLKYPSGWTSSPTKSVSASTPKGSNTEKAREVNAFGITDFLNQQTKIGATDEALARLNMGPEVAGAGLCPDCRTPMTGPVLANSHTCKVCMPCRIVLPYSNEELAST